MASHTDPKPEQSYQLLGEGQASEDYGSTLASDLSSHRSRTELAAASSAQFSSPPFPDGRILMAANCFELMLWPKAHLSKDASL